MNASATGSPSTTCANRPGARGWLPLLLSFTVWTGAASAADELPRSDACHTALRALEQAESALADTAAASAPAVSDAERQRSVSARLYPMRKRVADACLGGLTTSPPPSQHTWLAPPPIRSAELPPRRPPTSTPPPTPIPVPRFEAPITISNCNGATCLASDGSVLTRVGPGLVGPRGACTVQGAFLHCP